MCFLSTSLCSAVNKGKTSVYAVASYNLENYKTQLRSVTETVLKALRGWLPSVKVPVGTSASVPTAPGSLEEFQTQDHSSAHHLLPALELSCLTWQPPGRPTSQMWFPGHLAENSLHLHLRRPCHTLAKAAWLRMDLAHTAKNLDQFSRYLNVSIYSLRGGRLIVSYWKSTAKSKELVTSHSKSICWAFLTSVYKVSKWNQENSPSLSGYLIRLE